MSASLSALKERGAASALQIASLIEEAYRAGYTDGSLAMRDSILRAANGPMAIKPDVGEGPPVLAASGAVTTVSHVWADHREVHSRQRDSKPSVRAPRGLLKEALEGALRAFPGSSVVELEQFVTQHHPEIASKSVGNQLRRFEGELYRREGKYKWFLMEDHQTKSARPEASDLADLL